MADGTDKELELLEFLNALSPLEWRKLHRKEVQSWASGKITTLDCLGYPPFFSFRFRDENVQLIEKLRFTVSTYCGKVAWTLAEHKRIGLPGSNFIICPVEYWLTKQRLEGATISPGEYMARENPDFGAISHADVDGLTAHIKKNFSQF